MYVGGLRARLVWDSLYFMLHDALDDLGWFDSGRRHLPINMQAAPVDDSIEIPVNTLTVAPEDTLSLDAEMGSSMADHRLTYWVDFYAESDVLGHQLINDVKDILQGRMPSIGRSGPNFKVWDYTLATPIELFYCDLEDVEIDRGRVQGEGWRRSWYAASMTVVDTYGDELTG